MQPKALLNNRLPPVAPFPPFASGAQLFNRHGGVQCVLGNLGRHKRQRGQGVGSADDTFVGHFRTQGVPAQTLCGRYQTFFDTRQPAVAKELFALIGNAVFIQVWRYRVNVETDDHDAVIFGNSGKIITVAGSRPLTTTFTANLDTRS